MEVGATGDLLELGFDSEQDLAVFAHVLAGFASDNELENMATIFGVIAEAHQKGMTEDLATLCREFDLSRIKGG